MPDYDVLIRAFRDDTASPRRARAPARRAGPSRAVTIGVVGLAMAAATAIAVLPERALDGPLASGPLTPEVTLAVDGEGTVSGTRHALDLGWAVGTLGVEVTPAQGVHLVVKTGEATVEVVGTGFDVRRDALGTTVDVRHGRVRVSCATGSVVELGARESGVCAPTTAAGLLGRVRALQARGMPYANEVTTALARADAVGTVRDELQAVQLDGFVATGDPRALPLAEELAAAGGPRALDAHRVAARLAGDCARALPHLAALDAASALGADAVAWEQCRPAGGGTASNGG